MKRKALGKIDLSDPLNPKVSLISKKSFQDDLRAFKDGSKVWMQVETYYKQRSLKQNSVLHWYLSEIADETGMEMADVKSQMAKKYLTVDQKDKNDNVVCDPETGEVMTRTMSTTELTTMEFNDYTEKIRMWANDYLNLSLPLPSEPVELKFKDNY